MISSVITIDVRMYRMSGIGRYLQLILPELLPRLNATKIRILGNRSDLQQERWTQDPRVEIRNFRARIFSIEEQFGVFNGTYRGSDLLWVPHYNVPLLYSGKLLVTIHDLCQLAHPEWLGSTLQRGYARLLINSAAKRAESILCDSEFTAREVERFLHTHRSRIVVAYPWGGAPMIQHTRIPARTTEAPYLLAVGNLKRNKNLSALISAFEGVLDRIPHDMVVVGQSKGFLNSDSQLSGVSSLLGGRVRFTGHVTDEELYNYYRNATALFFPSLYEGFGLPLIEAMAFKCPVACSNASCLPEVVGGAALLFDPFDIKDIADAIVKLATDSNLRAELIERGLQRVQFFQKSGLAETTAAVINQILSE